MVSGVSSAWRALMDLVDKIAPAHAPVLIQGEAGSGKEVVARIVHARSPRRDGPFLAVNCGTTKGDLLKSELFGSKDAFTGATATKSGLIAATEGGTLLLDEISEMSGSMQVRLLQILERGEYCQVGGTQTLYPNVRFAVTSNRDLQELVLAGRFQDDLFYRMNSITLRVPPLRERPEDVPLLAEHFLQTLQPEGEPPRQFSMAAVMCLSSYYWPGNVRELRHAVERLVLRSARGTRNPIEIDELATVLPIPHSPIGHNIPKFST
ncbi:MAG: sigma 54-interacting transcriptional regulator [Nitrospiraceae bacterium]